MDRKFCPVSLGDWLKLCLEAGVPAVPATKIASMTRKDYLRWDTEGPHRERLGETYMRVRQARQRDQMVRFDCCAGLDLKQRMAEGVTEWEPDFGDFSYDDPRLLDIVSALPYDEIALWQRPWIKPYAIAGYPVEYRVFVRGGQIVAISNYYPQRPIPHLDVHLAVVANYTRSLIKTVETPFIWPGNELFYINQAGEKPLGLFGIHFSADYIVGADNAILFLEGGPPHEFGAASCCFKPNEVKGIALEDRNDEPH